MPFGKAGSSPGSKTPGSGRGPGKGDKNGQGGSSSKSGGSGPPKKPWGQTPKGK